MTIEVEGLRAVAHWTREARQYLDRGDVETAAHYLCAAYEALGSYWPQRTSVRRAVGAMVARRQSRLLDAICELQRRARRAA